MAAGFGEGVETCADFKWSSSPRRCKAFFVKKTEGWNGEGEGRRVQDGEHMYTCGGFILIFGKTNTVM